MTSELRLTSDAGTNVTFNSLKDDLLLTPENAVLRDMFHAE